MLQQAYEYAARWMRRYESGTSYKRLYFQVKPITRYSAFVAIAYLHKATREIVSTFQVFEEEKHDDE